jgi:hypothetical protein
MKKTVSCILSILCISLTSFAQGLQNYRDIIDLDDEFEIQKSNIDELKLMDLSGFWNNETTDKRFGFIGSNYRRLRIKFISITKANDNPSRYKVYGKSKVSDNICSFHGTIDIKESYYIKTLEYPDGNTGILAGEYTFNEDPKANHSGIFKGRFVTYWYKDKNGNIKYNDLWSISAMYNNNQFVGVWVGYGKRGTMTANWGDGRIPQSGDLDVGTSEFGVDSKYRANGWDSFLKAYSGGYSKEETEKALKTEHEIWWNDK